MRKSILTMVLAVGFVGAASLACAEDGVRVRPIDVYVSGFGGYSFPFTTDMEFLGQTIARDEKLDQSPSFGGKVGIWFTGPRKRLGVDIGVEFDVTHFDPNWPGNLNLSATYFGVHALARVPMGVTQGVPNGRWFPYVGFGGGGQRLTAHVPGATFFEGAHTAPAFQGLWGAKVFLTKHIAVFGEGKYTYAFHSVEVGVWPFMLPPLDLTVQALHGVGGLSVHF
ncbi:MAG: porin family protein [Nitrospira sp.]|nr:porin family protein [Nitrospira sp.]